MNLSPSNRIFLNIVVTYGRSLFMMVCGIFTGRWLLMALGETDYGLSGVICGLTAFIAFFNTLLSGAIARYYAYSVGESRQDAALGLENCRKWFNTALLIHTTIPLILLLIGYPIGEYAVRHWLTIPVDRIEICVWVFRYSCIGCFLSMVTVPYYAMYTAKQYIAELTLYSFINYIINLLFVYYMVTHPAVWLEKYIFVETLLYVGFQVLISIRARFLFPECRICIRYFKNFDYLKQLFHFSAWQFFGNFGELLRAQGTAVLVNVMFGPQLNATMAIGSTISSKTQALASSMTGAFSPALSSVAGEKNMPRLLDLSYRVCKYDLLLCLVFIVPVCVEIRDLINLWLKVPPPHTAEISLLTLCLVLLSASTRGIGIAVTAYGRISAYYLICGLLNIITLPVIWIVIKMGWGGFYSVLWVAILIQIVARSCAVGIAHRVIGFSAKKFVCEVLVPVFVTAALAIGVGIGVRSCLSTVLTRIFIAGGIAGGLFVLLSWFWILKTSERMFFLDKVRLVRKKIGI